MVTDHWEPMEVRSEDVEVGDRMKLGLFGHTVVTGLHFTDGRVGINTDSGFSWLGPEGWPVNVERRFIHNAKDLEV